MNLSHLKAFTCTRILFQHLLTRLASRAESKMADEQGKKTTFFPTNTSKDHLHVEQFLKNKLLNAGRGSQTFRSPEMRNFDLCAVWPEKS